MAGNRPARERFEFSLDASQVAGVILGSLAALGCAFLLGSYLGRKVAERPLPAPVAAAPAAARAAADPLAGLDQAPRPAASDTPAQLTFHETLTSTRPPPDRLPPAQAPAPAPAKVAEAAAPAPAAVAPAAPPATVPSSPKAVDPASTGWFVQLKATQDRADADRTAARFASRGARVVAAEVPEKGLWYRVRIGPYADRRAAERVIGEVEKSTGVRGIVAGPNGVGR